MYKPQQRFSAALVLLRISRLLQYLQQAAQRHSMCTVFRCPSKALCTAAGDQTKRQMGDEVACCPTSFFVFGRSASADALPGALRTKPPPKFSVAVASASSAASASLSLPDPAPAVWHCHCLSPTCRRRSELALP